MEKLSLLLDRIPLEPLLHRIFPFLLWGRELDKPTLRADFFAGLTGAVIVLPQGIAFAMIAGLPPVFGLYTAMITPVIAGLFGSSRHLVSGPTTAISLVIFATVSKLAEPGTPVFIEFALAITLLAGVFQLLLGLGRMGTLINFVSHVVVVGFTAGAALLIILSQLKNLLGMSLKSGGSFISSLQLIWANITTLNVWAVGLGIGTMAVALASKKYFPKIPYLLVALFFSAIAAFLIGGERAGLRMVGEVSGAIPTFSRPGLTFDTFNVIAQSALAVAILGLIEAVAIARAIATKSRQEIDPNQEFIGQGLSNIVGGFFSCYAGSGSFTRSGINYEAGAKTPMAAIFAALILLVIVLFIAPLIRYLPLAGMAGIIVLVGYNLIDFHFIRTVKNASKRQLTVLIVTLFATIFLDLEFAIFIGVLTSLVFYLQRTSTPNVAVMAPDPEHPTRQFTYIIRKEGLNECPQMKILRIDGSIFFGSIAHISAEINKILDEAGPEVKFLLIQSKGINFVDVAGSEWVLQLAEKLAEKGGGLYFTGLKIISQDSLVRGGYKEKIGEDHFFFSKDLAIKAIFEKMDPTVCAACKNRIFLECGKI